jgi:hypothetical protein
LLRNPRRPSFARLGYGYHAFLAVDRHRGVQRSGAIAKVFQKFLRVRALHESGASWEASIEDVHMSNVLMICGSLRKGSFNRALMNALPALAPADMKLTEAPSFRGFPL